MNMLILILALLVMVPLGWALWRPYEATPRYLTIALAVALVVLNVAQAVQGMSYAWFFAFLWVLVIAGNAYILKHLTTIYGRGTLQEQHTDKA